LISIKCCRVSVKSLKWIEEKAASQTGEEAPDLRKGQVEMHERKEIIPCM
jgi:hypothetical protein